MSRTRRKKRKGRVRPLRLLLVVFVLTGLLAGALWLLYQTLDEKTVIELDAGHDQTQPGYVSDTLREADLDMEIVLGVRDKFAENSDYVIQLTHDELTDMNMTSRLEKIDKDNPDLTISIHTYEDPYLRKTGTLIVVPPSGSRKSISAAEKICASLQEAGRGCEVVRMAYEAGREGRSTVRYLTLEEDYPSGAESREIFSVDSAVMEIQLLNMNDTGDAEQWTDPAFKASVIDAIAKGILSIAE